MSTSTSTLHPLGVIHGRFQVLHLDHMRYLMAGKELCRHLVIGVTNPDPGCTRDEAAAPERSSPMSNPLTYYERQMLLREAMAAQGVPHTELTITPLPISTPELYRHYVPMDALFFLTIYDDWGRAKLARFQDMGLATHVLWERPPSEKGISATDVRLRMAGGDPWESQVPPATIPLYREWGVPDRIREAMGKDRTTRL